ncbi:hypothetical protein HDV00_011407 [Rhizophlyctis rosea]|nr:hypothetical protein HDV00_011407 [Rhizophlyctis rosea]
MLTTRPLTPRPTTHQSATPHHPTTPPSQPTSRPLLPKINTYLSLQSLTHECQQLLAAQARFACVSLLIFMPGAWQNAPQFNTLVADRLAVEKALDEERAKLVEMQGKVEREGQRVAKEVEGLLREKREVKRLTKEVWRRGRLGSGRAG